MTPPKPRSDHTTPPFRTTLLRVMAVQVVSLILLWILQARYGR
jgi:hypothetical protein